MWRRRVNTAIDWIRGAREKIRARRVSEPGGGPERPRIGLALSGGFARGIAHIGVFRVLHAAGIPIDCMAGTSVGSFIGGAYCAGVTLEGMESVARETRFSDFGRWTPSWLGLATNKRLETHFEKMTTVRTFEEMVTPFAIAATDLKAGVAVYYTQGPVGPAMRGSCAYPGLFVPVQYEGRMLVDGFLTAPVPVEGALLLGADIVIAVNLEHGGIENPRTVGDVISRSFSIIEGKVEIAWRQQADVIIEPDVRAYAWDDFTHSEDMITAGEVAALRALPQIRALIAKNRGSR